MSYLKIKDNVDLKELKKFGFKLYDTNEYQKIFYDYNNKVAEMRVEKSTREIFSVHPCYSGTILLLLMFDLIQAGLVEKVEEAK